jgi:hypothetical protein
MQLNTTCIEILQAGNGFSVAINRPVENPEMPFDPDALMEMVQKLEKKSPMPGDEWKELVEQPRPLKSKLAKKPRTELMVFASFDEMVNYLRWEFQQ